VAPLIVLDASVAIAALAADDPHHQSCVKRFSGPR
jgi:predicted nucleic acid-binding protein